MLSLAVISSITDVQNLFKAARYSDIISFFSEGNTFLHDDPYALNIYAASLFRVENFDKAHNILKQIEPVLAGDSSFLSLLGITCRRLGDLSNAEYYLNLASDKDPDSLPIMNNLANLYIDSKKFDKASELLDKVLSIDPEFADAQQNKSRLSFLMENSTTSQPVQKSSGSLWSSVDPLSIAFSEEEVAIYNKQIKHKYSQDNKASKLANQLSSSDSSIDADEYLGLARKALAEGEYTFSLKLCTQSLNHHGASSVVYEVASDAYLSLKLFNLSEDALLTAHALGAVGPKIFTNLSSFALMRNDFALAKSFVEKLVSLDPSNPNISQLSQMIENKQSQKEPSFSFDSCLPK